MLSLNYNLQVRTGILLELSGEITGEGSVPDFFMSPLYECRVYGCYEDSDWYDRFEVPQVTCTQEPAPGTEFICSIFILLFPTSVSPPSSSLSPTPTPVAIVPSSCSWVCESSDLQISTPQSTLTEVQPTPLSQNNSHAARSNQRQSTTDGVKCESK